jgi:hypothetical protein
VCSICFVFSGQYAIRTLNAYFYGLAVSAIRRYHCNLILYRFNILDTQPCVTFSLVAISHGFEPNWDKLQIALRIFIESGRPQTYSRPKQFTRFKTMAPKHRKYQNLDIFPFVRRKHLMPDLFEDGFSKSGPLRSLTELSFVEIPAYSDFVESSNECINSAVL